MRVLAQKKVGLTHAPVIALGLALAIVEVGCARPASSPPVSSAVTTAAPKPEPKPVTVAFSVTRPGEDQPLITGQSSVGGSPLRIESDELPRRGKASLELRAHRRDDGSIEILARYAENDGQTRIAWEPAVHVAPRTTVKTSVSGAGWAREITITAE